MRGRAIGTIVGTEMGYEGEVLPVVTFTAEQRVTVPRLLVKSALSGAETPTERTYTMERAAHARAVATAKGRRIGRPVLVDADKIAYAAHLRDELQRRAEKHDHTRSIPAASLRACSLQRGSRHPAQPAASSMTNRGLLPGASALTGRDFHPPADLACKADHGA